MNTRFFSFEVIINSRLPFLRLTAVPPFLWGDFSGGENNGDKMKAIYSMGANMRHLAEGSKKGKTTTTTTTTTTAAKKKKKLFFRI